jgi:tetratricopeptide (TPR) repeat protein
MTTQSALATAIDHHRSGRITDAQAGYRRILSNQPDHADALHLLGMLLHNTGSSGEGEQLIRRAILLQPKQALYQCNLGVVLASQGRLTEAVAAYRLADSLEPGSPQTLNNLGVALHASGETAEAVDCFKRAVLLNPDYTDAQKNLLMLLNLAPESAASQHALGDLLHEAGHSSAAIAFYRRAIELDPASAESHNNLGNALFATGEQAEALIYYQRALELAPQFPQALNNLANALKHFDRLDEAIVAYRKAVELQPGAPEPLGNLGNALRDIGQWDAAMECYRKALVLQPDHPPTHNNIGNAWSERGQWMNAISAYENALKTNPDYPDAINNLGTALQEIGQRNRAMQLYRRANQLDPQAVSPPWNIALLQLLNGDYENGWRGYENRWRQKKQCRTFRNFKQPMWNPAMGSSTVLLHAEQGFGDAIQFCRYATQVAQTGATVLLECPPKLVRLCSTLRGVSAVIPAGDPLPHFDSQCPLMSLPMVLGTTLASVPAEVPYLHFDPADAAKLREKFSTQPPGLRVGLVWAGQSTHQKDRHRSLTLQSFAALGCIPRTRFYSLQVGEHAGQASHPPAGMKIIDWTSELDDFADTASLISQLDLVVTVDTAVAHLAGAMGKLVWILLAFEPDWRWLLNRRDSPWYPSARLFRQPEQGNWDTPLKSLAEHLTQLVPSVAGAP